MSYAGVAATGTRSVRRGTETDPAGAVALLEAASTVTVLCHVDPDADALGSALALGEVLRRKGAVVQVAFAAPECTPESLRSLPGAELLADAADVAREVDLLVTVDCGTVGRLGALRDRLGGAGEVLVIDHHFSNSRFGTVNLVDDAAESTTVVVCAVLDAWGVPLDRPLAHCLYAGLVTDTGSFRRAGAGTHELAARLISTGIDPVGINRTLIDTHPFGWLGMLAAVLGGAELEPDAAGGLGLAYAVVTADDAAGLRAEERESVVDPGAHGLRGGGGRGAEGERAAGAGRCRCGPRRRSTCPRSPVASGAAGTAWPPVTPPRAARPRCWRPCAMPSAEPAGGPGHEAAVPNAAVSDTAVPDTAVSHTATARRILGLAAPALPVLAAEPVYLLVDTAVVGRLGAVSLGALAVGGVVLAQVGTQLTFLSYGTTARAARLFGAGRRADAVGEGVQATWIAVLLGLVLVGVTQAVAGPVTTVLAGEGPVARGAQSWLRVAVLGVPFILLTLAGNGWMRGVQDTVRPLRYVLVGNGLSAAACPWLVHGAGGWAGWGLPGLGGGQRRCAGGLRRSLPACAAPRTSGHPAPVRHPDPRAASPGP